MYASLCRPLRQPLGGGLTLRDALRTLGRSRRQGALARRLSERIEQGDSFAEALASIRPALAPLFLAMTQVGEETGRLPETLRALEEHYEVQERLARRL